jgi:sirohydrochlorin cobaltochelatase
MGSAGLRFDADGRVAWNEMWATFCDLAMAGGPPHKGTLLQPASPAAIEAEPERYMTAMEEICRGVWMVTELPVYQSPLAGWARVMCDNEPMAGWLLRAIVMENVSAQSRRRALDLPVGPHYRIEKETKNVITVIAKTCHYWLGHMSPGQQERIGDLLATINADSPLVTPPIRPAEGVAGDQGALATRMAEAVRGATGRTCVTGMYDDWLGVDCGSVRAAIWMMRAMVVSNVLARREGTVLFVPINPGQDPDGEIVAGTVIHVHGLAAARRIA